MYISHMISRLLVLSKSRRKLICIAKMMFALKGAPLSTKIRYHRFGHIACETYKIHKNLSTPPLGKQDGGSLQYHRACYLFTCLRYLEDFLKHSPFLSKGSFSSKIAPRVRHVGSIIEPFKCVDEHHVLKSLT